MEESIQHTGIVTHIRKNFVDVQIISESACSGCHVRNLCNTSESKQKTVRAQFTSNEMSLKVGDSVIVEGSMTRCREAVAIAYLLPLFLIVITLFLAEYFCGEGVALLLVVALLVVYYASLYVVRHRIGQRFGFRIVERKEESII
ncbi:MAG: SoxR reducing system RseC family protein [Bacteroidaceae bacterium]|nr:SoxR reducing system RseC family protein [Bacteroidaceae bacterium]